MEAIYDTYYGMFLSGNLSAKKWTRIKRNAFNGLGRRWLQRIEARVEEEDFRLRREWLDAPPVGREVW